MNFTNIPAACDLGFDGFDAGLSLLETGGCLGFTLLVTLSFFFVLLTFFTVNSSSSLSAGSLKSSSLSESGKELLLFYWPKKKINIECTSTESRYFEIDERVTTWCQFGLIIFILICTLPPWFFCGFSSSVSLSGGSKWVLFWCDFIQT